ncbi:helix-turn-helix domain-containing protein [Arthrobacter sp. SAFR-179]|uniref:helix-turn-helix domain-containing protein n=1 Tax=Arthrobacter sp. SAFR-179 TaxID=3387279 RepID=UPI003F7BCF41
MCVGGTEEAQVPSDRLYTVDDLSKLLQISTSSIRTLMVKERWPHSKYGTRIRFQQSDVEAIRAMHRADVSLKARPRTLGPSHPVAGPKTSTEGMVWWSRALGTLVNPTDLLVPIVNGRWGIGVEPSCHDRAELAVSASCCFDLGVVHHCGAVHKHALSDRHSFSGLFQTWAH